MTPFSLQHRKYIGTTSMDPELSFIMTNLALVNEGDLVLDPFCGTGFGFRILRLHSSSSIQALLS